MFSKLILISLLVLNLSCKSGGGGKGEANSDSAVFKSLFSEWTVGNFYLDFSNGSFNQNHTMYLYMPNTQEWINALNMAGRDTTGLVAGVPRICEITIYFVGNESQGVFSTNHPNIDTPHNNACLEWDSNCVSGVCNYAGDHVYTKTGDVLVIDYFGSVDNGMYGVDYLE